MPHFVSLVAPVGAAVGDTWQNPSTGAVKFWNGSAWTALGLAFTELVGGEDKSPASPSAWEDWDLSAIIGAGAKYVLLAFSGGTARVVGARKNGSGLARFYSGQADAVFTYGVHTIICECDASRIIEIYVAVTALNQKFQVMGYWS